MRAVRALVVFVCIYNVPQLVSGSVQFDGLEVHYASQRYLSDELHAGHLPFWTPYLFSGFPFLADLQVGAWYPLNWPFFLAGITPRSIGGELLLHDLIASTGAYALANRMIGRPASAVAAGMFYGLSGWFAAHSQHVGMFDTAAWLPWLVLLLQTAAERLSTKRLALAGVLGAAVMLPGHFQIALYTFSGVAVWAALESLAQRSWRLAKRFAIGLVATVVWGGLIATVMLLPALELVQQSIRTELNAVQVDLGYFHPASVLTLVNPDYYGLLSGHYSGPGDSTQHYFYGGILLVPLSVIGVRHTNVTRMAVFLGTPFLWYALGPVGGLFRLLARLPGFSSVELPMHGWFLPALGLALLGAAGVANLEARFGRKTSTAVLVFTLVDVLVVNQLSNPLAYARTSFDQLYGATLNRFQAEVESARPPVQRIYGPPLASVGYRNHALQSRVDTTYGYNPLELRAYAAYASMAEVNPKLVDGFAANYQLTDTEQLQYTAALPLAYFAHSITATASLEELDPSTTTLVTPQISAVQWDSSSSVTIVDDGEQSLTLHYVTKTQNVVRVAIAAFPGWHAQLNGSDLPVLTTDDAFVGVVVPAGEGDVRLFYAPRFFVLGVVVSALAVFAAAGAVVASGRTISLRKMLTARQQYQAATLR